MESLRQVAVIMNTHLPYDRKIIQGIAAYMRTNARWSVYVESEPTHRIPALHAWHGDGLIVDFDDRRVANAITGLRTPVVGLGGGRGWFDPRKGRIPYFETDNAAIGRMAAQHLLDQGFTNFAYCGFSPTRVNIWSKIRSDAFIKRVTEAGCNFSVFHGRCSTPRYWDKLQVELISWLRTLPRPVGIAACNDARARHVLEACRVIGARVPDDVAVVGVDNDEIICELATPPLSSIEQGAFHLGFEAARLLNRMILGGQPDRLRYLIEPSGVVSRQSTDLLAVADPEVASALRLIREQACTGLQVEKVVAAANVSRSTLDTRFKVVIGRTIAQEIQRVKLETAKRLLSRTTMPLKQVARTAGYANVQYLASIVRKNTGQTPACFRSERAIALSSAGLLIR
jgi:LacI family transcriptional regulator